MSDKQPHGPVVNQNKPKLKIDNKQTDVDAEDEGLVVPEEECATKPLDDVGDEHGRIKLPKS
ncbi:MAG: hypothetical protein QM703_28705 [Gemmatales bacterium]